MFSSMDIFDLHLPEDAEQLCSHIEHLVKWHKKDTALFTIQFRKPFSPQDQKNMEQQIQDLVTTRSTSAGFFFDWKEDRLFWYCNATITDPDT